jgi:hypothetical protein
MSTRTAQQHHEAAKELERAAHHHREAAVCHEVGDAEEAARHARLAAEHVDKADGHIVEAAMDDVAEHGSA